MHAQGAATFAYFKQCRAYETALELKAEGKIRHFGISFHDRAEVLEQILTEYPQVEVVQIQFNYLDYEDPAVESRKCYEVCRKYGKPVIVMEPVKGGTLANLPEQAQVILDELGGGSAASYAIRYAAGFDGMMMVLSGMSSMDQMVENISFMKDFRPLDDMEVVSSREIHLPGFKDTAAVNRILYSNNYNVEEVFLHQQDLEEYFIELMGGTDHE